MKSFEVTLTLAIDAMHEESAENKLDSFLSALDLKKNDKLNLLELGELIPTDGSDDEGKSKKSKAKGRPKLSLENEDEWDDSWEDEDWDSMDEEDEDWDDDDSEEESEPVEEDTPEEEEGYAGRPTARVVG